MAVPRDKTLDAPLIEGHDRCDRCKEGYHSNHTRKCSECGSTDRFPATHCRRRTIGGKRGRNSGKVSQHGK